jgi:hypothetical protein
MKAIIALIVALIGPIVASAQSAPEAKPRGQLTDFAEWVTSYGKKEAIGKGLARYFGMPAEKDDLLLYTVVVKNIDGSSERTFVRRRDSGRIDIFFLIEKKTDGTYFYKTTADGKLLNAAYDSDITHSVTRIAYDDAQPVFEHEKSFWLQWLKAGKVAGAEPDK